MQATRFSELTPRSVWDIVDDAFDLYRERFVLFLSCACLVYVPLYLLRLLYMLGAYERYYRQMTGRHPNPSAVVAASMRLNADNFVTFPLLMFGAMIFTAMTALIVNDHLGDRVITSVGQVFRLIARRFWILLAAGILVGLATIIGFFACVLPSLFVAVVFAFVPAIIAIEPKGVFAALRRSYQMILPDWMIVFGLTMLIATISGILSMGIIYLVEGIFYVLPHDANNVVQETQQRIISEAVSGLVSPLLAPLGGIALTLLYFDFRVRREGLDIAARAEEIEYPLAPDPFGEIPSAEARRRQQSIKMGRR
jgi:hypothetical protein